MSVYGGEINQVVAEGNRLLGGDYLRNLDSLEKAILAYRRRKSPEARAKIKEAADGLGRAVDRLDGIKWTPTEFEIAGRLGLLDLLGSVAAGRLEDLDSLVEPRIDEALRAAQEWHKEAKAAHVDIRNMVPGFNRIYGDEDTGRQVMPNFTVLFLGKTKVGDMKDLERTASDWGQILEFGAATAGSDTGATRLVAGLRGSIGFAWNLDPEFLLFMGQISVLALQTRLHWLQLKEKELQLKDNPLISDDVREAAAKQTDAARKAPGQEITALVEAVADHIKNDPEAIRRGQIAVRKTIEYVVDGAVVDPKLPTGMDSEAAARLAETEAQLRLAEHRIHRLEAGLAAKGLLTAGSEEE